MRQKHRSLRRITRFIAAHALACSLAAGTAVAEEDLTELNLEDLMTITVTSASKRAQTKADAAAAITVLTQEDIERSGATSIPEVLRLVPGLNVARIDAHSWAISARGFNGQFANKLLVLIDGRVVYTPLFGGVYWDTQDVVMEDIDRIEVIRGPGGTLWGANAVNGVVNIITKKAEDTQGTLLMGLAGNQEYDGEARYGGKVGEDTAYRVWGRGFKRDAFMVPDGSAYPAYDGWWQWRVGARVDSDLTEKDTLTIQGDFYDGQEEYLADTQAGNPVLYDFQPSGDETFRGGDVLTRWTHQLTEKQSIELQAYWDQTRRDNVTNGELRNSVDVVAQHDFMLGKNDEWLFNWGLEYFWTRDEITPGLGSTFDPLDQNFSRFSGFGQVQWNLLGGDLQLTAGTKLEWNTYTDFEFQPTGRALWKFAEGNAVWASISRAVREPTRADRDISFLVITGNKNFQSENLLAYELGYRNYMLDSVTVDLALFYNDYTDFAALVLPAVEFQNSGEARAWGGEIEVGWSPIDDLRFVTSYAYLQIDDQPPSNAFPATASPEGANPQHTWMMRGFWDLPVVPVELDATVWYVSKLDSVFDPTVSVPVTTASGTIPAYWRLDLRLGWQALDWLLLEAVGQNLTEQEHLEWGESFQPLFPGTYVPRSYYGKVTLTF